MKRFAITRKSYSKRVTYTILRKVTDDGELTGREFVYRFKRGHLLHGASVGQTFELELDEEGGELSKVGAYKGLLPLDLLRKLQLEQESVDTERRVIQNRKKDASFDSVEDLLAPIAQIYKRMTPLRRRALLAFVIERITRG